MHLNVHGNSATATKLATARKITVNGAVSGSANFDGSGNITIPVTAPVSKVTKTLTDSGITIKVVLRKQFNIVYANLYFTVPKNTTKSFTFASVFPSGYEPLESLQINSSSNNTGSQFLKLFIKSNGITGLVYNSNADEEAVLIAQVAYIVD